MGTGPHNSRIAMRRSLHRLPRKNERVHQQLVNRITHITLYLCLEHVICVLCKKKWWIHDPNFFNERGNEMCHPIRTRKRNRVTQSVASALL